MTRLETAIQFTKLVFGVAMIGLLIAIYLKI